jgi:dipeptidyl aminopeptidase/acylaminoacyl peptidase
MKYAFLFVLCFIMTQVNAQENLNYQTPPEEILELVDIERAPGILIDNRNEYMVLISRNSYQSIEELSQEELRLGGLRINPKTNIGSRVTYYNKLQVKKINSANVDVQEVSNLPKDLKISNFTWSPDQKKIAFTHTTADGVEVWVLDLATSSAKKLTDARVNANLRNAINWFKNGQSLLVKMLPEDRGSLINSDKAIPRGPTVSVNEGKKAQNRTYQDLLKNKNDEYNFEQLALSEIYKVNLDGTKEKWLGSAMYNQISFSPDGKFVLVNTVEKPFSYLVPYYRFPSTTVVYSKDAKKIATLAEDPLVEDLPQGFMARKEGKRSFSWRKDQPASIIFVEALDGGDPKNEVEYRDEVFELKAPFDGKPTSLIKLKNVYSYIDWGNNNIAVAHDYWWNTRNTKSYTFNPSDNSVQPVTLIDRNYQDMYSDPGRMVTTLNKYGEYVLQLERNSAFLIGDGYTEEGQFPFLDKINLKTSENSRLYLSEYTDKVEDIRRYDLKNNRLLVRIESPSEYPNYFFKDLSNNKLTKLTDFANPFESIQNAHKEVIQYKRDDGVELSGTLYLPVGYDTLNKKKMPMIMWAYPREFKDKSSAGQNTKNPNEFTYPYYGSMVYWITRGYVVLDDASFPIVGEGDEEPNDSFRKQLVNNAKAAIDAVDALGYIDRNRVAIGGHSYGAFMVANLLSHSDLFAAGIARSGAYNRTLTPFGFQSEERNYWEAPEIYYTMSPFMHADKMKSPLLLIHGEEDNNSGTYPMQSERYFNALKGLGATVRLVMLPKESHGYRAKESILHLLWEQDQWLEKYVKNKEE